MDLWEHPVYGVMTLHDVWNNDGGTKYGEFVTVKDRQTVILPVKECHRLS